MVSTIVFWWSFIAKRCIKSIFKISYFFDIFLFVHLLNSSLHWFPQILVTNILTCNKWNTSLSIDGTYEYFCKHQLTNYLEKTFLVDILALHTWESEQSHFLHFLCSSNGRKTCTIYLILFLLTLYLIYYIDYNEIVSSSGRDNGKEILETTAIPFPRR